MPLWRIAWRSIQRRALASSLTTFSMALGVMLVVAVLLILGIVQQSFRNSSNLGYDLIVGGKGGQLQLVLNTVFHLSKPIEPVPYSYYQEFLTAGEQYRYFRSFNSPEQLRQVLNVEHRWRYFREFLKASPSDEFFPFVAEIDKGERWKQIREFVDASEIATLLRSDIARERLSDAERWALCRAYLDESEIQEFFPDEIEGSTDLSIDQDEPLDPSAIASLIDGPSTNGRFAVFTGYAIPMCMGDYYQGFRVVGTTPDFFDRREWEDDGISRYKFSEGRNFRIFDEEHGYFEAVIGSRAAKKTGLRVGDNFSATHGPEGHSHDSFVVVGILAPSGTANDQALFINLEGFYLLDGHAKPVEAESSELPEELSAPLAPSEAESGPKSVTEDAHYRQQFVPLSIQEREVTAFQVRTRDAQFLSYLQSSINEGIYAQGVLPIMEIFALFERFVRPMEQLLLLITVMICVVSGLSILVSIYNSMSDRRREIAVMRALGAGRGTVMGIILLESVMLSLGGGLVGWIAGHGIVAGLSGVIEERTGVLIRFYDLTPPELLLIPGLSVLAVLVGFLPALSAYRTDVAEALSASP